MMVVVFVLLHFEAVLLAGVSPMDVRGWSFTAQLAAEHVYLIPVLCLLVLPAFLVSLLLPGIGTEVLERHSVTCEAYQVCLLVC